MIAFKVVKVKVDLNLINFNLYFNYENILVDLNNIFGVYKKVVKVNNNLYNLKFYMKVINFKKIFNKFLVYFIFMIILLKFDNINKILNLRCIIIF